MNNPDRDKLYNIGEGFYSLLGVIPIRIYWGKNVCRSNIREHYMFLYAINDFLNMTAKKVAGMTLYSGIKQFDVGSSLFVAR
jgi:hypothetical protein